MPMEGYEVSSEIHVKKLVSEDIAANVEENPDTKSSEHIKKDAKEKQMAENQGLKSSETEGKHQEIEEQSSPRGVLEITISGSDSDNGSTMDRCSSFESEKTAGVSGELNYGNLYWKKLFNQIKTGSLKKFPTISLLGGHGYGLGFDQSRKKMMRKKIGRKSSELDAIDSGDIVMPKPSWRNFSFEELKQATDNFSPDKLIGKGGHAEVYKGRLPEGQVVAVKKIIKEKKKDEERVGDFLSELGIIAHIDHTNAAKLVGFSANNGLQLVLQFAPHGSLATALHVQMSDFLIWEKENSVPSYHMILSNKEKFRSPGSEECLEWKIRCKVAIGVAEGLQYLHYNCPRRIIHRDITASNILLSEDYEAQISDFGLAKWLPENWVQHVVSPIEGTFGYMAPEYFMHGIIHEKTDVFAFGVLLLELITGRRAVDSCRQSLVMWAKPHLENNNVKELADPRLGDDYDITEMKRAMFVASTCIHYSHNIRPNMKQVVQLLRGDHETVQMKQKSMGRRELLVDACDLEEYTCTTYLKDLNRHMELVME